MIEQRIADVMKGERERLHREREAVFTQQQDLENTLKHINRELAAIDAYEAAKTGKQAAAQPPSSAGRGRRQARRGSRREALLQLIGENPDGLSRGEILDKMGLKGDKSGEMSVSNALTALTKSNQVSRSGGKYHSA